MNCKFLLPVGNLVAFNYYFLHILIDCATVHCFALLTFTTLVMQCIDLSFGPRAAHWATETRMGNVELGRSLCPCIRNKANCFFFNIVFN